MNYKSLNSAIQSVTNPQPKNEALTSLQENIDLYNAVLPYTVGLQSVITLVMIEALLDGSGPIAGTANLFKSLMKKWKARVLGGKLSADQAESFIAEYEKLSATLPTGKRNFLKASFNKMEQAAKAGDKGKLGAIATEVKSYLSRNSAEVKEDYQTRERDRQMANTGQLGSALDSKEKASKKVYGKDGVVAHKSLADMLKKANKKASVKEEQEYIEMLESALESIAEELECDVEDLLEDYQTPGRAAETKRLRMQARKEVQVASRKYQAAQDTESNEKESPNTYATKGKVVKPSKKMLKTRASSEKAKETKRSNEINKYRSLRATALETSRKNAKTPQGRRMVARSIAQGQRNDLGW